MIAVSLLFVHLPAFAGTTCPADVNNDLVIDIDDLLVVIGEWGATSGPGDVDGSGLVDIDDLLLVIGGWGPCPVSAPTAADVAGLARTQYPFFEYALAFNAGATVQAAVDPSLHPGLVGQDVHLYVVDDRSAAEWSGDATLIDVRPGGFQPMAISGPNVQSNIVTIDAGTLSGLDNANIGRGYDVVIDANRDGLLGAGDIIDGADGPGFAVARNISLSGPLAVTTISYTGGSFLGQRTSYPTDISGMGQLPLVVISHGNGHQYTWYDYLLTHLASYGYVVMSHQNNTVPGVDSASLTTLSNTDYLLNNLATIGGGVLNGHIDTNTIIWIGHSRGGEGIVRAYDRMADGASNPVHYDENDIKLMSSIAPTDFLGTSSSDPRIVPYHLLYGSSDGDVCGCPDNDIADSFNVFERARGPRASTYVHGADHNDFNCCGINDFQGPAGTAIGNAEAQDVAKAAILALIKYTLEGDPVAKDFLWRQTETLRSLGVSSTTTVVSEFRDALIDPDNFTIDDFQTQPATNTSSSAGLVTFDVLNLSEGVCNDNNTSFTWASTDPMNGMVRGRSTDTARNVVFDYNAPTTPAFMEFQVVPAMTDWSDKGFLSLRAAQGTRHPETIAVTGDQTFTIVLRDNRNVTSAINIGAYSGGIEEPYQRTGFGTGTGWQNEYETIRIRLGDFLANGSGLDLSAIVAVRFEFGGPNATSRGRVAFDDIVVSAD